MKIIFMLLLCVSCIGLNAEVFNTPAVWPPTWTGVSKGADDAAVDEGTIDDHTNFDCGKDVWGYWANIEVTAGLQTVVWEMRFVENKTIDYGLGLGVFTKNNYGVISSESGLAMMGSPPNEQGARNNEQPQRVIVAGDFNANGYWMSARECSQELWELVRGITLVQKNIDNSDVSQISTVAFVSSINNVSVKPVECQSYTEASNFCTSMAGLCSATTVRLPSEKEWEFACRAGTATAFWTGRTLTDSLGANVNVNVEYNQTTMYGFDPADIGNQNNIKEAHRGDVRFGGMTPKWAINPSLPNLDGLAGMGGGDFPQIEIGGVLTVDGGTVDIMRIGTFDSRYQNHYVVDHYGTHTPILMIYEKVTVSGVDYYDPRPYADRTAANMYYRYLDISDPTNRHNVSDYVLCTMVDNSSTGGKQNHHHHARNLLNRNSAPYTNVFDYQKGGQAGDWYSNKQMEYREMVSVYVRYAADGTEDTDGEFIKDYRALASGVIDPKTLYPIRSMYSPARYQPNGLKSAETAPAANAFAATDVNTLAKSMVPNDAETNMTTYEYIEAVTNSMHDYYNSIDSFSNTADFYSGPLVILDFSSWPNAVNEAEDFDEDKVYDKINVNIVNPPTLTILGRNPWGLFDLHGNVWEWTTTNWDGISDLDTYDTGTLRIIKGGSWKVGADRCRSAARAGRPESGAYDDVGFRFIIE
ncbi:MAG: SUMF1/EgtB/PvdO family nonheme iron enzyme [Planctomycetes bacterium]|nr:SUMF1/EgtB/PvdO family nonheme iron enzyme [Planctomycetota bacterium]